MTPEASVLLFTRDTALQRRLAGALRQAAQLKVSGDWTEIEGRLDGGGSWVVLFDVRNPDALAILPALLRRRPPHVVIAIGKLRSDPLLEAEQLGVYACEDLDSDRLRFQSLVHRALDYLQTREENEQLRQEAAQHNARATAHGNGHEPARRGSSVLPLQQLSQTLRRFDKVDALFETVVENVASSAMVSRVGLYYRMREASTFKLCAGLRCLQESREAAYGLRDPLPRWMAIHAHLISRSTLDHVRPAAERKLLQQALDAMGAEVIIPLHARGELMGWLFIGHRVTGIPFEVADLEELSALSDHVSTVLENALLYEEVTVQKTLAETVLQSMPTGIVAVGEDGIIRWFNSAAERILNRPAPAMLGASMDKLGSRLLDLLRRSLLGGTADVPREWFDPDTKRHVSVQVHRLMSAGACMGVVALIHDLTAERQLEEKKDQLERTAFWTELAASMSHEIRNPLVAIKTFAQLLPERFGDPDFRTDFSRLVNMEVDRLNNIIEQINQFAHPPELRFKAVLVRDVVQRAQLLAEMKLEKPTALIENRISPALPAVRGDEFALAECFSHLILNAMEATQGRKDARIELNAQAVGMGGSNRGVLVSVKDNGPGLPADIREKAFSPFCTSKTRGMGLGLPLVKRTVVDHNGRVDIDTGDTGTTVSVVIPLNIGALEESEADHETHIDRRR